MNKPSRTPRFTFCAFGCEAAELSFAPPEKPPERPTHDREARELAQVLRNMADKCLLPLRDGDGDGGEQLLALVRRTGLYQAASEFAAVQWDLVADDFIENGADCVFMTADEIQPDYEVVSLP